MNNFEDWLTEIEPKRSEEAKKWETVKGWLKAAYQAGCETSKIEAQSLINSLKEERRCIIDADKPPEMGFEIT